MGVPIGAFCPSSIDGANHVVEIGISLVGWALAVPPTLSLPSHPERKRRTLRSTRRSAHTLPTANLIAHVGNPDHAVA